MGTGFVFFALLLLLLFGLDGPLWFARTVEAPSQMSEEIALMGNHIGSSIMSSGPPSWC